MLSVDIHANRLFFLGNVKKLAGSGFYQLRQLRTVRRLLTRSTDAAKALVHDLMSSRVDYCNSVLYAVREVVNYLVAPVALSDLSMFVIALL